MLLSLSLLPAADERVTVFRSGPFEVYSTAGDKPAREILNRLEQFRHVFGHTLGKDDLQTVWPVRIRVVKPARNQVLPPGIAFQRDLFTATLEAGAPLSRFFYLDLGKLLLEANIASLTDPIERGLLTLYSTIEINGPRVTLGAPPPEAERTRDWARMHLLSVHPDYSGRLRVMLANLQKGVDPEPACRNAFEKTPAEIERQLDAYIKAGQYGTTSLAGRPIRPDFDFPGKPLDPPPADAKSALDLLDAGDLAGAAQLNPRWGEPVFRLAQKESDPAKIVEGIRKAIALDPRNRSYREALAAAIGQNQLAIEEERRHRIEDQRRELETLKLDALRRIREAEMKANEGKQPVDESKVQEWWDGAKPPGKLSGTLQRVDCIGAMARLVVLPAAGAKPVQLLVRDPGKIVLQGGGVTTLGCGAQRPPRRVTVEYFPKPDSKMGTAGDAAVVEFQ